VALLVGTYEAHDDGMVTPSEDTTARESPPAGHGPWNEHLRLATVSGIPIGINWSVLIIAWLIGAGLAGATLPDTYPGYSDAEYAVMAALAVACFLASILGHELAHAAVAQRSGVTVEGITLWLIGGVALFADGPPTARSDLRIAAAGPAASILIGLAWFGLGGALAELNAPALITGTTLWLGAVNLIVAAFNLLPAFPLDGGRMLRAWLWGRRGDQLRATRTAAIIGRGFAVMFVIGGVLLVVAGLVVNAIWVWLIAWFLNGAAVSEVRGVTATAVYGDRTVAEVMSGPPTCLEATTTIADALEATILRNRWSAYPVVDHTGRTTGLLTLDRIRRVPDHRRATTTVGDAAHPLDEIALADPDEQVLDALQRMDRSMPQRVVVVEEGVPVGIVSISDVVRELEIGRLISG